MQRRNFERARRLPSETLEDQAIAAKGVQGVSQKRIMSPEMRRAQYGRHRARGQRVSSMHASPTTKPISSVLTTGTLAFIAKQSAMQMTANSSAQYSTHSTIKEGYDEDKGSEGMRNFEHPTKAARAQPKNLPLRSILKRNGNVQEPTPTSQIVCPPRLREMAERCLAETLEQSGADCSRDEIVSRVHAAILTAEAGVKSAFDISATDDKYDADIKDSKNDTLLSAEMDIGLNIGPSVKEEGKPGRKCRYSGANNEAPKVLEKADALFEGDLVDLVAQLFDAKVNLDAPKKLPSTPGPRRHPLRRMLPSEEEREPTIRHAEEEQCLPAASKKRGFAEVEAEFKTPERRRWVDDDDDDDKKKGNPMKRRKSRGVTEMCLEHVMLDERDASEEQRAEAIERFYAPLHRGSAKCVELMFKSVLKKGDK